MEKVFKIVYYGGLLLGLILVILYFTIGKMSFEPYNDNIFIGVLVWVSVIVILVVVYFIKNKIRS